MRLDVSVKGGGGGGEVNLMFNISTMLYDRSLSLSPVADVVTTLVGGLNF